MMFTRKRALGIKKPGHPKPLISRNAESGEKLRSRLFTDGPVPARHFLRQPLFGMRLQNKHPDGLVMLLQGRHLRFVLLQGSEG